MKSYICFIALTLIFIINNQNLNAQNEAFNLVKSFIEDLDKKDFKSAYEKVNITSWGDYKQFSSAKAFGSITWAKLFEIREENDIDGLTGIYVDAEYLDPVNGNARYKEKFYVAKIGSDLKIVKFKLVKKDKLPETSIHPSDLDCSKFYLKTKDKLGLSNIEDIGDFIFYNLSFTGLYQSECLVLHKIKVGNDDGNMDKIGFLCFRNNEGKWTLSSIVGRFADLKFYDFDKDSIMEIAENQNYEYLVGVKFLYLIYSWKNIKFKALYEYASSYVPIFQQSDGDMLTKGECILDETDFELKDENNDGFLELIQNLSRSTIYKDCKYSGSLVDEDLGKFIQENAIEEKRTIIYSYKNGKFVAE
jgi:hypothetical protein